MDGTKEILETICFFCTLGILAYFSLASVSVRSAVTHVHFIPLHILSGKINKSKQRTALGLRLSVTFFDMNRAI